MDIKKLQYPIGVFEAPARIDRSDLEAWIGVIARFPSSLNQLLAQADQKQYFNTYRPGGWNVHQLVNHCADSHLNAFTRFKLALTEDSPVIKPYAEDTWAELPDGRSTDLTPAIKIIEGIHARWVLLMRSLEPHQWKMNFFHPEKNSLISLEKSCGMYAWHCRHHLAHLSIALKS